MSPERPANPDFAAGRRRKAVQFLTAAEEIMDLADDATDIGDAYVTLCVHAGIAAAAATTAATTTTRPSPCYAASNPTAPPWPAT